MRVLVRSPGWIMLGTAVAFCAVEGPPHGGPGAPVMAAVFTASFLSGMAGGVAFSALCGVALIHLRVAPMQAVQIMMMCSISNQARMVWAIRSDIDWRRVRVFLLGGAFGLPFGLWLLLHADHRLYTRALGAFLLCYGGTMLAYRPAVLRRQHPGFDAVAGLLGGITGVAAAFPSAPVTIWCSFKGWTRTEQRSVFQPFILVMQLAALVAIALVLRGRAQSGAFSPDDVLCVPAALLGTSLGLACSRRFSTRQFAIAMNLLLIVAGVSFVF